MLLGSVAAYAILLSVCFALAIIDWPTIPAPQRVQALLADEFGVEPGVTVTGPRYAFFGIGDGSEFYRFTVAGRYYEKWEGSTKSYLILDDKSTVVLLRRVSY